MGCIAWGDVGVVVEMLHARSLHLLHMLAVYRVVPTSTQNRICCATDKMQHEQEAEWPSCRLLVGMVLLLHTLQALN